MTWVPTLADAERWVAEKEAVKAIYACRPLVERMWRNSPEYKAFLKAEKLKTQQRKIREAIEREERAEREKEAEARREAKKAAYQKAAEEIARREYRARRSRIDWSELIDNPVTAERQVQWERQSTALAMHKAGLTYRAIGERMGLTKSGVHILVRHARRRKPGAAPPSRPRRAAAGPRGWVDG